MHDIGEAEINEKITVKIEGGIDTLPMKMTIYAPLAFRTLVDLDSKMIDPITSLDPANNQDRLVSFKNPDGGKSGEFFFFSQDERLILKTLSDDELKALLLRLPSYLHHITSGSSMISIIYGVFSFERLDVHPFISFLESRSPQDPCVLVT